MRLAMLAFLLVASVCWYDDLAQHPVICCAMIEDEEVCKGWG